MNSTISNPISPPKEKRITRRRAWARKAQVEVAGRGLVAVCTHDISENGLGFFSEIPITEGSTCTVSARFYIRDTIRVLNVSGRVIHCWLSGLQGYRIGMAFGNSNESTRALIKEIVSS